MSTWQAVRATRAEREQSRLRQRAQDNEQKAQTAQAKEAQQRRRAEALAYAADINLAQQELAMHNLGRVQELLDRHRPHAGEPDLRGWEWRYLWKQCRFDGIIALLRYSNGANSLAVSRDGKWLASVEPRMVKKFAVWDWSTRRQTEPLPSDGSHFSTAASPRRTSPVPGRMSDLSPLNRLKEGRQEIQRVRDERASFVLLTNVAPDWQFTTNSRAIIAHDKGGRVVRWQGADFQEAEVLLEHPLYDSYRMPLACFSPDSLLFAVGSTNGIVEVWDLQQRKLLHQLVVSSNEVVGAAGILAQGKILVTVHFDDWSVHEWNLISGQQTRSWRLRGLAGSNLADNWIDNRYNRYAWSPDERWGFTLGGLGALWLGDPRTDRDIVDQLDIKQTTDGAFSADGKFFAARSMSDRVRVWNTTTLQEVAAFDTPFSLSGAFSPDGKRLAVGHMGLGSQSKAAIRLFDVESQQALLALEGEGPYFLSTKFSPNGNDLGSVNRYGRLHLWQAPSWAEIEPAEKAEPESHAP